MDKSTFKKKRIVFPIEGMNRSGGMRIIFQLAQGLTEMGNQVVFLVPDYASTQPFLLSNSVQVTIITTGSIKCFKKIVYRLKLCFLSTSDADIVIATGYKTPYYIFLSKIIRLSKVKLLYLIQHYEPVSHALSLHHHPKLIKYILYLMAKLTYRLPFRKVSVSAWIKEQIGCVNVDIIPNGVDLDVFQCPDSSNVGSGEITLGIIGSSTPWKGFLVFERAIAQITKDGAHEFNVLVATADQSLQTSIEQSTIIQPKNDYELVNFYHQCDIFIYPSLIEGFGLPPLEAMACGVPVIVSECGGVSEYCDEENSILVEPENVAELANAILLLINDMDRRRNLRQKGLETANRFSLEKMQMAYADLFGKI